MTDTIKDNFEEIFAEKSREAATEGIVLLKNENHMLPFTKKEHVTVFGRPMIEYYRSGTGSGGAVRVDHTTNIIEGMRRSDIIINEEVVEDYKKWLENNPFDNGGGGWAAEPWFQKDMDITEEYVGKQAEKSNKAVYVIGRTAGEDKDNFAWDGSFLLTPQEKKNLLNITKAFEEVCVILNISNIIDMKWVNDPIYQKRIKSILIVWQGGMEGGNAAADVLSGKVTPSGKLPDTIAEDINDYPSTKNFGNEFKNLYEEDIYVGYRYFETFAPDKVLFAFGYGMSYTEFDIRTLEVVKDGDAFTATVEVKNIGSEYAGKEVVQIYVCEPQGKLGKSKRRLVAFKKTKELKPSETQVLKISWDTYRMASFDDSGITGEKSAYVLEEGKYDIYIGNSVRNNELAYTFELDSLKVVESLSEAMCPNDDELMLLKPGALKEDGTYEETKVPSRKPTVDLEKRIQENLPKTMDITGDIGIKLQDVQKGKADLDQFVAQLSVSEMATLVRGEGMSNFRVTPGTASAFGGLSDSLYQYGIPVACCADGPSGVRCDWNTVQLPIGTALASSWNQELVRELYTMEGQELVRFGVDTLLGPGVNIHRNPLNGRNFEYYSEDPILSGEMAIAACGGIKDGGSWGTIKHFALNGQETHRFKIDAVASERAIREIYLKAFEMAVRAGVVKVLMTSYNPINGHWAASNYDLCTTILRNEWNYDGMVMTDWWAKMNDVVNGGEESNQKIRDMVRSGNDVYMVVVNNGAEINVNRDDTEEAVESGRLTVGELQSATKNILNFILSAPVSRRPLRDTDSARKLDIEPSEKALYETYNLSDDDKVMFHKQTKASMVVPETADYVVIVNFTFEASEIAQSTVNVTSGGKTMFVIQNNGTNGRWVTQKICKVRLEKGIYNIDLVDVLEGIKVEYIQFKKTKESLY